MALVGILTVVLGFFARGSAGNGLVVVSALPILLLAGALRLWRGHRYGLGSRLLSHRAGADEPVDAPRWHELLRWKLWRGGVGLVFGAEFALIADRWFAGRGRTADAHAAGTAGWYAEAAGIGFSVYSFTRPGGTLDEIERLLFPRRWNSKNITW